MAKPSEVRPLNAIPGDGQETHDGWSGFIPAEKFSNQGGVPFKGSSAESIEWPTRSGMQGSKK